jgi:DNA-binding beta-propeller fold protein YncE
MRRTTAFVLVAALIAAAPTAASAQEQQYQLVPTWPVMPTGMFFGTQGGFPTQAERDAAAARRREAMAQMPNAQQQQQQPQAPADPQANVYGQGISGIAIDDQDRIYFFNRGVQTVLVFDREGNFVRGGAERDAQGNQIMGGWLHSGEVDWQGNVWVIERSNQRILKFDPTLQRVLMQLGTTGVKGTDATHFDEPSGISVLRNGNLVVTDGYGNNRVMLFSPEGRFIKQVARGAGGPDDQGTGPGEWDLPHQAAVDANDNLYIVDRENKRIQVFDKDLNYVRQFANPGWNPWDIAITRKGDDGFAYIADHATEEVHKIQLSDGKILATWGEPGHGPGQFDWVHGMAVDSRGGVYAADTYGQRVQKFVPVPTSRTTSR